MPLNELNKMVRLLVQSANHQRYHAQARMGNFGDVVDFQTVKD